MLKISKFPSQWTESYWCLLIMISEQWQVGRDCLSGNPETKRSSQIHGQILNHIIHTSTKHLLAQLSLPKWWLRRGEKKDHSFSKDSLGMWSEIFGIDEWIAFLCLLFSKHIVFLLHYPNTKNNFIILSAQLIWTYSITLYFMVYLYAGKLQTSIWRERR